MSPESPSSSHRISPKALRSSFLLPIGIAIAIWLVGLGIYLVLPQEFNAAVALVVGISLLVFLFYWTRRQPLKQRITAVLLAVPALAGIALGLVNGRSSLTLVGVAVTMLLLSLQRFLTTPFSYRMAYRHFAAGNTQQALRLINKSIEARPDFWQSYQLRALLRLMRLDFNQAEADARQALTLKPTAHPVLNTLGQIYLAQMDFAQAEQVYQQAVALSPDTAVYHYHLGLSHYRQQACRLAAESLAAATRGTLPTATYDLWTHYYLGQSLTAIDEPETAQEAFAVMAQFEAALADLKAALAGQPDYPHMALIRADLADLEEMLAR